MKVSVIFFCTLCTFICSVNCLHRDLGELRKLDLTKHPFARCLDGSAGAFYINPAARSSVNATRWVFSLEGGGECVDNKSCMDRSRGDLGSSNKYPNTMQIGQVLSGESTHNPDMFDWNRVFIRYCSGDLFSGTFDFNNSTENTAETELLFRGHDIVHAVIDTLLTSSMYNMTAADFIVWSGDSAGGLGCFINLDYVNDIVNQNRKTEKTVRVIGLPIAGYYFSNDHPYTSPSPSPIQYIPWTYNALKTYYSFWHAFVPTRCQNAEAEPWKCLFADTSFQTLKTDVFIVQAQTDRVVMPLHNGLPALWDHRPRMCNNTVINCPLAEVNYIKQWKMQMEMSLLTNIKRAQVERRRVGTFHAACLLHTEFTYQKPIINGQSFITAFGQFAFHSNSNLYVDNCKESNFFCNLSCPGFETLLNWTNKS